METAFVILTIVLAAMWIVSSQQRRTLITTLELQRNIQKQFEDLAVTIATHNKYMKETANMAVAQNNAISQALSRINCFEEFNWLNVHYELIRELLYLRLSGVSEEKIVKEFMCFQVDPVSGRKRGWMYPQNNALTGKRDIHILSPYYVATVGVQFKTLQRLLDDANAEAVAKHLPGGRWNPDDEPPDVERRELPVYYQNENGDFVKYPGDEIYKPT
jgi:hypothetical protein